LQHSILEGKGQLMLPMKDKLALGNTDVKEMVAFMRAFRGGKQAVSGVPTGQPLAGLPAQVVAGPAAPGQLPVVPAAVPSTVQPNPGIAGSSPLSSASPSPVLGAPLPPQATTVMDSPASASTPAMASPGSVASLAQPSQNLAAPSSPMALNIPRTPSPEQAERLRVASEFFRTNCIACHGPDGTGNLIRPAMAAIPDFTNQQWHTLRSNTQLRASILDGKGTLMPPWTGKVTPELARDLVSFVRTFGPPELLASELAATTPDTQFEARLRELKVQWDDVERQLSELNLARARP
jgi:mono/diheme cytochrome c family protein